jgi:hypothetical protein
VINRDGMIAGAYTDPPHREADGSYVSRSVHSFMRGRDNKVTLLDRLCRKITLCRSLHVNRLEYDPTVDDLSAAGSGLDAVVTIAESINDRGVIVGQYSDGKGVYHGFLRNERSIFTSFDVPAIR